MMKEFDCVQIKKTGITGVIVDIHMSGEETVYIVESDEKGVPGGYGPEDGWKLFDCSKDELKKIKV